MKMEGCVISLLPGDATGARPPSPVLGRPGGRGTSLLGEERLHSECQAAAQPWKICCAARNQQRVIRGWLKARNEQRDSE